MDTPLSWQQYFTGMAEYVKGKSRDTSTQVGAVITYADNGVCSTGYNCLPRGVQHLPERGERPEKYLWTEHAERNAIYNAAKQGHRTAGCYIYVQLFPCADCARAIIQAGIVRLYTPLPDPQLMDRWWQQWKIARTMLEEAGVEIHIMDRLSVDGELRENGVLLGMER